MNHVRSDCAQGCLGFRDRSARRRGQERGFSLLEVIIALAIFTMAAIVLGSAYVNVLTSYRVISQGWGADEDAKFARAQLLAEPDLKKVEEGGEFDTIGDRHVRWTATVEPTTLPDLFQVTFHCDITDPLKQADQKITQTFQLLRPSWSDPAQRSKLLQEVKDRIAEVQKKL